VIYQEFAKNRVKYSSDTLRGAVITSTLLAIFIGLVILGLTFWHLFLIGSGIFQWMSSI
jgi:hypothetical protein